jgi:putative hydrolase
VSQVLPTVPEEEEALLHGAKRIDLHTHTLLSDGALLPSEHLRRAVAAGYGAIAITDHVDTSNIEDVVARLLTFAREQRDDFPLVFVPGVELTHIAPRTIAPLARRARELGAGLVVVHGETVCEPVVPGTNAAAVQCPDVDILAHPGLLTAHDAEQALLNGVHLELTSRFLHGQTNGLVARRAREAGAPLVVNTDAHGPGDLMDLEGACRVAAGAGLTEDEIKAATVMNPRSLVKRAAARLASFGLEIGSVDG